MPYTPLIEGNNTTRRMFAYDEMVMASDGTKFYIKYLDGPPPKTVQTQQLPSQQKRPALNSQVMARPSTANSQLLAQQILRNQGSVSKRPASVTTNQPGSEAKRPRIEVLPQIQNRPATQPAGFVCGICQQKFSSRASLNFHIDKSHKDTDGPVDCPCGKRFANKKYMKRHQRRRFETEKIICGREKPTSSLQLNYKNL